MNRRIYLENIGVDEALERWMGELRREGSLQTGSKWVSVSEALGRTTSRPVLSHRHSPHFLASAMDGIAVRAQSTYGARESSPVVLREESYQEVDTGDPLPAGFDAVVMSEEVSYQPGKGVELIRPVSPWTHVRPVGEDLMKTQMIVPQGHRIRPYDLGGFLAGGVFEIPVRKKPVFGIIPTGTEIVKADSALREGDLAEYNSVVFGALIETWGGKSFTTEIVDDRLEMIEETLINTLEIADAVIINAGSSAGREDYTHQAVDNLGRVLVHGLSVRPGKPALLGIIRGKPVIGLPGYPVSAILDCELLVRPLVEAFLGTPVPEKPKTRAVMSRRTPSVSGSTEFIRVTVGDVGDRRVATPIARGAGVISSLIDADGVVRIPELSEGLEEGEETWVELLRPPEDIGRNVVCIGSHDLTLDSLGSVMGTLSPGVRLSSANTGSFGGLMALRAGQAHLAGIHLLDPADGSYNESFVRKYLEAGEFALMNLVYRSQGLLIPKGNPLGIQDLADVAARGLRYVNRQNGSGTRILLDWALGQLGLTGEDLPGYDLEEYTHLGVGTAILAGQGDCGLGVHAAARVLDLDFIPLYEERFDLCLRRDFVRSERFEVLRQALKTEEFRQAVDSLGGYDLRDCGQMLLE